MIVLLIKVHYNLVFKNFACGITLIEFNDDIKKILNLIILKVPAHRPRIMSIMVTLQLLPLFFF